MLTIASLFLFSGTYVINRFLRQCNYIVLNAQNMLFSMIISAVLFACMSREWHIGWTSVWIGCINGILGFFCSMLFIKASQLQPASRIAALDFCQVPMGFLLDLLVFKQSIGIVEMIGCMLICLSGVFVFAIAYRE